jgi:hypothetical protein
MANELLPDALRGADRAAALARAAAVDRRACLCYSRDMTIKRLDHVSVVVGASCLQSKSVDDTVARLRGNGAELVGEVAQYEDKYRLCYMRGPAGIIVALAEELF